MIVKNSLGFFIEWLCLDIVIVEIFGIIWNDLDYVDRVKENGLF